MKYLRIKSTSKQVRADGTAYKRASFIEKNRKYGTQISEQNISVKRPVLVTGAHDSGKTRFIKRLYESEREIYGAKISHPALYLAALHPLSKWAALEDLGTWFEQSKHNPNKIPWKSLKQYERLDHLPNYLAETKALLFVDDAHKLTGRKLQIARECVMAANIYVMSASDIQRIPPNLRGIVLRRDPQMFGLSSDVSYDMTEPFMWILIVLFTLVGWWEASLVLGGLKFLATGRRATKDQ